MVGLTHLAALAVLLGLALTSTTVSARAAELFTGGFSFSDELGGFRLLSASGSGTTADPFVLVEEIPEVAPVTVVIRRRGSEVGVLATGHPTITLIKVVKNLSKRVWAGFEIELQEILKKPSNYGDGLSFNQFGAVPSDVASDSFSDNERRFEPYDRIGFENGHVDPSGTAQFKVTITDPTPVKEFYLVQDPTLLSAEAPTIVGRSFARLE